MTMTDDPDFLDELLTRYLDGEATDSEVARVESDAELIARVEQHRAVIDLVQSPITIPTPDLDRLRTAAIAESTTTPRVADLDILRVERLQRRNRILAVAAALVFLAVGVAAIQGTLDNDTEATTANASFDTMSQGDADSGAAEADSATAEALSAPLGDSADAGASLADSNDEEAGDDMATAAEMGSADGSDDAADEADPLQNVAALPDDLGAVADLEELGDQLAELLAAAGDRFTPPPADPFGDLCSPAVDVLLRQLPDGVLAVETAPVVIAGVPRQVAVATGVGFGSLVVVLVVDEACDVVEMLDVPGIDRP